MPGLSIWELFDLLFIHEIKYILLVTVLMVLKDVAVHGYSIYELQVHVYINKVNYC